MADPTFRAVSPIGTIAGAGGGGAGSVDKPTGTVDGDYIFIVIINKANAFAGNAAPSGFTTLLTRANTTYQAGYRIYGKVASSEPSSYSLTETSTANASQVFAISYSNPGATPINASVVGSTQTGTTSPSIPTLTTTATGKLLGLAIEYQGRSIALTAAGSMTSRIAAANTDASFILEDEDIATTGSISGRTATAASSGDFIAAAILLTSAAAAPTLTGGIDLADFVHSGTFAVGALSQLAGGITLDDFLNSGTLGLAPGRIDTQPFKNWSGTLLPGATIPNVVFLKLDRTLPLALANQVTAGDGVMTIQNAALVTGTYYIMVTYDATGANIGAELVLAT